MSDGAHRVGPSDAPDHSLSREATLHEILTAFQPAETPPTFAPSSVFACALCRLSQRSVGRWMRAFFDEFVNDPQTRAQFRRARAFCLEHTRQLALIGDALAVAILYNDLADETQRVWEAESARPGWRKWKAGRLMPAVLPPCPGCVAWREAEQRYTDSLAAGLSDETVWQAYAEGSALCIPHIELLLKTVSPALAERVRKVESERLARLRTELQEIIRKNDYRFRGEAWGEEKDAWLRVLQKIRRTR